MPLYQLAKLRPLYLVAVLLCWNAMFLAVSSDHSVVTSLPSLLLLGAAVLALAIVSACVKRRAWAQQLVLGRDTDFQEVRACLFFITFLSFLLAAWGLLAAWEMMRG